MNRTYATRLIGSATIGLVLPMTAAFSAPPEDALQRADDLFRQGQFTKAEEAYRAASADDPNNGQALLRLGEIALLGNRFAEAEEQLRRAIKLRPDDRRPKELLAETYYRQDKFAQAAGLFREVGREAVADKLADFQGLAPNEIHSETETTRVKFVRTDPLPVIRARFNGTEEGLLLIDTGASELYVDKRLVEKLGLHQFGTTTGTYAGGKTAEVGHARLGSIQLGDFEIKNLPVIVRDRGPVMQLPGQDPPVGIIGTVVFYHFITTLDYPNGELVLRRKTETVRAEIDRMAQAPQTHVVPFWMADTHFMVAWGTVNDSEPLLMFADTGLAGGGFLCPESTLKAAGIDISGLPSFEGMGGGGPVTVTPFTVKRLTLGSATGTEVTGFFGGFPPTSEYGHGFRLGGIISHAFFKPYALTFDFERMRFYLTQR